MTKEQQFYTRVSNATPLELARLISQCDREEEIWLRQYFGDDRFESLRTASLRLSSVQSTLDRTASSSMTRGTLGNVVILPGIMGSELSVKQRLWTRRIWLHKVNLFLGWFSVLKLAQNGISPEDSRYSPIASGYLQQTYARLAIELLSRGWNVHVKSYDWRKSLQSAANELGTFLDQMYPGQQVHIVAHSMGGLVARLLLNERRRQNQDPLADGRFIMLGTPNRGSYEIPRIFAGVQTSVLELIEGLSLNPLSDRVEIRKQVLQTISTFPGVYQMLPHPDYASGGLQLYDPATYDSAALLGNHLALAQSTHRELADQLAHQPLPEKTVYIAGYQQGTVVGIRDFAQLGNKNGYLYSFEGDGTVPHRLGLLPGVQTYRIQEEHGNLPDNMNVIEAVDGLLRGDSPRLEEFPQQEILTLMKSPSRGDSSTDSDEQAAVEYQERAAAVSQRMEGTRAVLASQLARTVASRSLNARSDVGQPEEGDSFDSADQVVQAAIGGGFLTRDVAPAKPPGAQSPIAKSSREVPLTRESDIPEILIRLESRKIEDPGPPVSPPIDAISVGHLMGLQPDGAVHAIDRHLTKKLIGEVSASEGVLATAIRRGVFRAQLGEIFFVPEPRSSEEPERWVVIAGMGAANQFGPPELSVLVRQLAWTLGRFQRHHLATVLFGTYGSGISERTAVEAWLRGLAMAALDVRGGAKSLRLEQITFVEFYGNRAKNICEAMKALGGAYRVVDRDGVRFRFEYDENFDFNSRRSWSPGARIDDDGLVSVSRISVSYDENAGYRFSAMTREATIPERTIELDPELVADVNNGLVPLADAAEQQQHGEYLGRLLLPSDFRPKLFGSDPVVVQVDSTTARIHWEMVAQGTPEVGGFVGLNAPTMDSFLALGRGLTRQFRTPLAPVPEPDSDEQRALRVLIVADPAEDLPLRGAREEGEEVANLFESYNRIYQPAVPIEVKRMIGPREATIASVLKELILRRYDILHFAGHCYFNELNPERSGWIFGKKKESVKAPSFRGLSESCCEEVNRAKSSPWKVLGPWELQRVDRIPPAVFSNACESGITPERADQRLAALAPSFAEAFFGRGVANFVCTAWPVNDSAAREFALRVYGALLGLFLHKSSDGRVVPSGTNEFKCMHEAMHDARSALVSAKEDHWAVRTWGAYQHYGNPFGRLIPMQRRDAGQHREGATSHFVTTADHHSRVKKLGGTAGVQFAPDLASVIADQRERLMGFGALAVEAGYVFEADGKITDKLAVVVYAKPGTPATSFPSTLHGFPVQVADAPPILQLAKSELNRNLPLPVEPTFDWLTPGDTLKEATAPSGDRDPRLAQYKPPKDVPLDEVREPMKVTCIVSPDAGWPALKEFLEGTRRRLTIGMYDFTAKHIVETISGLPAKRKVQLVLDPKVALQGKPDDIEETVVRDELSSHFGENFEFVWAAVKFREKVEEGIFPTAYHIKVAVRDSQAFWLSSGNWQSSNQPPDPIDRDGLRAAFRDHNREWHLIIENESLARTFEKYLQHDYSQAKPLQKSVRGILEELQPLPELLAPMSEDEFRGWRPLEYFSPKTFEFNDKNPLRIKPLLSPDNFASQVTRLVKSTKRSLYIQNQYIKIGKSISKGFKALLEAIKEKIDEKLDVKIILRDNDYRPMLTALKAFGISIEGNVRIASRTHTKGVIVDGKVVMVGSHNWSDDGVTRNRDASLILYNSDLAKYFTDVFLNDWNNRATERRILAEPLLADGTERALPSGSLRRISWNDYYEDWEN